jgi:hypothetical protein
MTVLTLKIPALRRQRTWVGDQQNAPRRRAGSALGNNVEVTTSILLMAPIRSRYTWIGNEQRNSTLARRLQRRQHARLLQYALLA